MTDEKNNMICDLETGVCGPVYAQGGPRQGGLQMVEMQKATPEVDVYCLADPACAHSWPSPSSVAPVKQCLPSTATSASKTC